MTFTARRCSHVPNAASPRNVASLVKARTNTSCAMSSAWSGPTIRRTRLYTRATWARYRRSNARPSPEAASAASAVSASPNARWSGSLRSVATPGVVNTMYRLGWETHLKGCRTVGNATARRADAQGRIGRVNGWSCWLPLFSPVRLCVCASSSGLFYSLSPDSLQTAQIIRPVLVPVPIVDPRGDPPRHHVQQNRDLDQHHDDEGEGGVGCHPQGERGGQIEGDVECPPEYLRQEPREREEREE